MHALHFLESILRLVFFPKFINDFQPRDIEWVFIVCGGTKRLLVLVGQNANALAQPLQRSI